MNLIELYVAEVGKRLPRRNRADIETEIKSTLQDMLDERSQKAGKPADEAMTRELLKEYGAPAKVAASYLPTQYLIGPRLFPMFLLVTRIVVAVLVGVSLFGLAVGFVNNTTGPDFIQALGKFALQLFGGLIMAFGNIVLVFAILERVLPASKVEAETAEDWDPAELQAEPDPQFVKPAEPIFSIIFTVIGLIVLNLYPNLIGVGFVQDGRWVSVPMLSDAFFRYLPWINLLAILNIGLNVVLLRTARWSLATRIADILFEIGGIILAGFMLAGPSIVELSAGKLAGTPLAPASTALVPVFGIMPIIVLVILIVVSTIEVAKEIYRLIDRPVVFSPVK